MGFDIVHMNLHKTFAVPHGGGGPGAGPVAVSPRLADFLPGPLPVRRDDGTFTWSTPARSIGRIHTWHGNALALARAWSYILANGGDGLRRVAEGAVLNANWLRHRLRGRLRPALRPAQHARVRGVHDHPQEGQGRAGPRRRQAPPGGGVPRPDRLLPPDRRRGADDRAHRDGEPPDGGRPGRGPGHHRRRPGGVPAQAPRTTPVGRVDEARAARTLLPTWDAVVALSPDGEVGAKTG